MARREAGGATLYVRRDTNAARWWLRGLARRLAAREARALAAATDVPATPRLICWRDGVLERSWLDGEPMHVARPQSPAYFRHALRLLRHLHRAGIAHNDLAKEPNWLVRSNGRPAILDFQLATVAPRRGRLFRMRAREDIRYLLKHKRTYCPASLTERQRRILATPAPLSRIWRATGKRVYWLVTRRLLHWADREGAGDRNL
ncbi:serine/threonine-protein kinase [soil metagenome]